MEYLDFLRLKLQETGDQQRLNEYRESMERVNRFEKGSREALKAEIKVMEENKNKEIEDMKKNTADKMKKLELDMKSEQEKFKAMSESLMETADKELKDRLKIYDAIILKNMQLLEVDQLNVERDLLETDADLRRIHENIEETVSGERERTEKERRDLAERQKKRDEEQMKEVIEKQNEKMKMEIEAGKELVKKHDELQDKQIQCIEDLNRSNMITQQNTFKTLLIRNEQYNNRIMNDLLEKLSGLSVRINEYYAKCRKHMPDGTEKSPGQLERAKRTFDDFSALLNRASSELTTIHRRLAEIENSDIENEMRENIRKMKATLFSLGNCVSDFSGRLMVGNVAKNVAEETELKELMMTFSQIEFPSFASKNDVMRKHLGSTVPSTEQPDQHSLK